MASAGQIDVARFRLAIILVAGVALVAPRRLAWR